MPPSKNWRWEIGGAASRALLRFLALLVLLLPLGCHSVAPVVKVGLVAPFEGRERAVGYDAIYAARLAVREFNEQAQPGSFRVALVALDDGGTPLLAREAAATLVADPDVVVALGHWLTDTTAAATDVYASGELPLIRLGEPPLVAADPAELPAAFQQAYAGITPFDEVAGRYAGPTYDALSLSLRALEVAESGGAITRESVAAALERLQYEGLTGPVYRP